MQNFIIIFVWEILGKMLVMNFDGLCEPINPKDSRQFFNR